MKVGNLFVVVVALWCSASASGQTVEELQRTANDAYMRGDFATAARIDHKLARDGIVDNQFNFCIALLTGKGVPQDYSAAFQWCEQASNSGDAAARRTLGKMFENGHGTARDDCRATQLYGEAKELGDPEARDHWLRKISQNLDCGEFFNNRPVGSSVPGVTSIPRPNTVGAATRPPPSPCPYGCGRRTMEGNSGNTQPSSPPSSPPATGCRFGQRWNGQACVDASYPVHGCPNGTSWNGVSCTVRGCQVGTVWDGKTCK